MEKSAIMPQIELEFIGAAQTVTGSKHLIRTSRATILLDCGLFQGRRKEAFLKNQSMPIDAGKIDAVVLSHAHMDHSGALPSLVKNGYRGPVFCTPATRDLAAPMLLDTAFILKSDAEHIDRLIERGVKDLEPVTPLYDENDVIRTLSQMVGLPYHQRHSIAPGISLTYLDAGHVLGSAISVLDIEEGGRRFRLAFTGDLGRTHMPILRDPEIPEGIDALIMESTYGDRLHDKIEQIGQDLSDIINRTYARGGKVIIPSFALERAQEIISTLKILRRQKKIPEIPVYVDSPLTVKITDVFKLHPECYDRHTFDQFKMHDSPFDFPGLEYIATVEDSKRIDQDPAPSIIISASGMCEGGRILHHLRSTIGNMANTILIVGFQAEHTLGRRIVEMRPEVKIFGMPHRLNAEVCVLNSFSAHADQADLLDFALAVKSKGPLDKVMLVHGESKQQESLMSKLKDNGFDKVFAPAPRDRIRLID